MTHSTRQSARRAQRGFSLVEVVIASAVLLFILVGVTQLSIYQSRSAVRAVMNAQVPRYAQNMIELAVASGYCANADQVAANDANGALTTPAGYVTGTGAGATAVQPTYGTVYNSTTANYTLNARTITGTLQVTDTTGNQLTGADPLLITATLTWVDPTRNVPCASNTQCAPNQVCCDSTSPYPTCPPTDNKGQCMELYVQQEYISPPPSTASSPPPPCT